MLLRRERAKLWPMEEIIRETRSSQMAVAEALTVLQTIGLVAEENGLHRYWPATPKLEIFAEEIEKLFAVKPTTVIKAIMALPNDKLRTFSDAFRLRE